jgi:serine/threonine-protein kinase
MLQAGDTIGGYLIEREIDRGASAIVWYAVHEQTGEAKALKELTNPSRAAVERARQREALLGIPPHENLVLVERDLVDSRALCLVMEYVNGRSLDFFVQHNGSPALPEALALFDGVLAGVAHIHAHRLVHRDLKPANVLIARRPNGELWPRVTDFGLVKFLDQPATSGRMTVTGLRFGTPHYMSPEQIEDSTKVTASADIFALGCILYELVCGQRAYPKAFPSVWMDIIKGRYVSPRRLRPDLPESVINAIDGCLEVRPARRILDVCELRLVLAGELRWSRSSKTEEERTEEQEPVSQTLWHEGRTSLPDGEKMVAAAAIAMSPSHLPDESPNTEERSQPSLVGAPSPVDDGLQAQLNRARSVTRVAVVVAVILAGALLGTLLFLRNEIAPALDHTSGVGDHQ